MTISHEERTKLELRRSGMIELLQRVTDDIHAMSMEDFAAMVEPLQTAVTDLAAAARARVTTPGA